MRRYKQQNEHCGTNAGNAENGNQRSGDEDRLGCGSGYSGYCAGKAKRKSTRRLCRKHCNAACACGKKAPRQIAEAIVEHIDKSKTSIEKVEIAGPGFINFYLDNTYLTRLIPSILHDGADYGRSDAGRGKKIQVEFVSANPTGDLHLGHARGAAVGDSLCNILEKAGYEVTREYYINDAGNQIHNLALSVEARYFQALGMEKEMPADGYYGQDIIDLGKNLPMNTAGNLWTRMKKRATNFSASTASITRWRN